MRFIAVLLTFSLSSVAQDSGRFTGLVTDPSGAVIPGATIKVLNEKTGAERVATADSSGVFFVPNLAPSTYTITGSSPGMSDAVSKQVNLAVGQERTVNITMQPVSVTTEISVSSANWRYSIPAPRRSALTSVSGKWHRCH